VSLFGGACVTVGELEDEVVICVKEKRFKAKRVVSALMLLFSMTVNCNQMTLQLPSFTVAEYI